MSWTFNGYYLNGTRQGPTKDDHAQDALDQTDGDIKLCRLSGRSRELERKAAVLLTCLWILLEHTLQ